MNPFTTEALDRYRSSERRFVMLAFARVYLGFVLTVSVFFLFNLLLLLIPTVSMAQMQVSLTPTLLLEEEYNDNWYRSEEDEKEFWVTRIWAGFGFGAYTARSSATLKFAGGPQFHYSPDSDANASNQDYWAANADLGLAYRLSSRLTGSLVNSFTLTREPASTDQFSEDTSRELYWRNRLSPSLRYDMAEKGAITLSYQSDVLLWVSNTDEGQEDSTEHKGIVDIVYYMNSRNHVGLNNSITHRSYNGDDNSSYYAYQGKFTFWHEFNSYFSGRGGLGYQYRDYDSDDLDDQGKIVFDAGLTGKTDRTMFDLSFIRDLVSFTTDDEYYSAYRVNLFLQRKIQEALRLYAGGYYQNSDYQNSSREDDTYSANVGLGYRFFRRLFEVSAEYGYRERDSNEPGRDYEENRVFFRLSLAGDVSDYISRMTGN